MFLSFLSVATRNAGGIMGWAVVLTLSRKMKCGSSPSAEQKCFGTAWDKRGSEASTHRPERRRRELVPNPEAGPELAQNWLRR
jgi:hypothetical protein